MAHLSRSLKVEDVAMPDVDANSGDAAAVPAVAAGESLFSSDALSHAISGSIGGNIAMLGDTRTSSPEAGFADGSRIVLADAGVCVVLCSFLSAGPAGNTCSDRSERG